MAIIKIIKTSYTHIKAVLLYFKKKKDPDLSIHSENKGINSIRNKKSST